MHFVAHFEDESVHGNPLGSRDSGWTSLPDKPILSLEYITPNRPPLILQGYEEYLHMVEVHQMLGGPATIDAVYLMGRKNGQVVSHCITVFQERRAGDISVKTFPVGKEYHGGPTQGWRKGAVT